MVHAPQVPFLLYRRGTPDSLDRRGQRQVVIKVGGRAKPKQMWCGRVYTVLREEGGAEEIKRGCKHRSGSSIQGSTSLRKGS